MSKNSKTTGVKWNKKNAHEDLPTAFELASLAADVMKVFPNRKDVEWIEAAWDLHYLARCRIAEMVHKRLVELKGFREATRPILDNLPKPKTFPVPLHKALQLLMPNQNDQTRLGIYLEYAALTHMKSDGATNRNEWEQAHVRQMSRVGFDELDWITFATNFKLFRQVQQIEFAQVRARKGGLARAEKKLKKSLGG